MSPPAASTAAVRLVLVCHATTAATRRATFGTDIALDERGAAAATDLAGTFGRVVAARCAPARQCRQTADALGLPAEIDPELRDGDFGRWTGLDLAAVQADDPAAVAAWLADPAAAPHGGESLLDLLERVGNWLDGQDWPPGRTVAVTHPVVVRAAVVHAIRATPASFWRIDISPLSRTILSGHNARWNLQALG